eukprot:11958327-Karenia_brevis.AAC.1
MICFCAAILIQDTLRHPFISFDAAIWAFVVISFCAAISACEKGGQWQQVAPLSNEMQQLGPVE